MRAFVAVALPKELWPKVKEVQERIEMTDADIKFTEPATLHYNLKFLGEITAEQAETVKRIISETALQFTPFTMHVAGVGAFPSNQYARVVWIGAKAGSQELKAMAELLDLRLSETGFKKEERPFEPHLTLGRVKSARNNPELIAVLRELEQTEIGNFKVEGVELFESKLGPEGPVYSTLYSAKLKA